MFIIAKKSINLAYTNGELSLNEDNQYILTETTKDGEKTYNLSIVLDSLVGNDSLSIAIKTVDELPSEE